MASLLSKYNLFMEAKPLLGVSISTGVCYGIGDYLAQYIEQSQGRRDTTSARVGDSGPFKCLVSSLPPS